MIATANRNAVAFPHLTPTIAISWLKAIGLLRLSGTTGYWADDCFYLEIDSVDSFVESILNHYQPKPFVSPWNSYSLFGKADGLDTVLASQSERYALMRQGYHELRHALQALNTEGQSSAQKKLTLMAELPFQVNNTHWQEWIRAVGLLTQTKNGARFLCNDLLGTGGNVGTTDFCTAYYQVCSQLWNLDTGEPAAETEAFIRASVLGEPAPNTLLLQALLGHTYPAADFFDDLAPASAAQADYLDNGGRSSQLANPIDLILYLEGAVTFTGKVTPHKEVEREGEQEYTLAAYPLLLEVNSGSADTSDRTGRSYEVWLPLWDESMDWRDFQDLVTTDLAFRLKHQIIDTIDMLDVITQVDEYRGLARFARFGLWTRKGQGKYLIYVGLAKPGESDIGAELRAWRLRARPENLPPESQAQYNLLTAIQKTLYRLQQGNAEATAAMRLLGQLELLHSRMQPKSIPPCPQLREKWVEAVYEEYPIAEVELAAALVSAVPKHHDTGYSCVYSFRQLLSSAQKIKDKDTYFWSQKHTHSLKTASFEVFCLSVLKLWNVIWEQGFEGKNQRKYHPSFGWKLWASPDAIASFIAGRTNDQLILELALGFALCKLPQRLGNHSNKLPLPEPYKYATSIQWSRNTMLTTQTINGLRVGSTALLQRQLAALPRPILPTEKALLAKRQQDETAVRQLPVLPDQIAIGDRCALALVFPCKPFYTFGETDA